MSTKIFYDDDPEENKETPAPENAEGEKPESETNPEESLFGFSAGDDFQKFLHTFTDLDPVSTAKTKPLTNYSGTSDQSSTENNESGEQTKTGEQNPDQPALEAQPPSQAELPDWLSELGAYNEPASQTNHPAGNAEDEKLQKSNSESSTLDEFQKFLRTVTNLDPTSLEENAPSLENRETAEQFPSEDDDPGQQPRAEDQSPDRLDTETKTSDRTEEPDWFSGLENSQPPVHPETQTSASEPELSIHPIDALRQDLDGNLVKETLEPEQKQPWYKRFKQNAPVSAPVIPPFLLEEKPQLTDDNAVDGDLAQESTPIEERKLVFNSRPFKLPKENQESNWKESDTRLLELQETFETSSPVVATRKASFFSQLRTDFEESNPLFKGITLTALVLLVILIFFTAYDILFVREVREEPAVQPQTTLPFPIEIQFPGGWTFALKQGAIQNGSWNPTEPEWLQGTEISRLVSIPWNKQLGAIYNVISPGDEFLLNMSNGDVLSYKVETTQAIKSADLNQLTIQNSPSLVVILSNPQSDFRQVIIAAMNLSPNVPALDLNTKATSIPQAALTPIPAGTSTP